MTPARHALLTQQRVYHSPTGDLMLAEILVPLTQSDVDPNTVNAATALARHHGCRVVLTLGVVQPPVLPGMGGAYPGAVYVQLYREERERAAVIAEKWRDELQHSAIVGEVRVIDPAWRSTVDLVAVHARYADLIVMPAPSGDASEAIDIMFADLLTASGRPVLVVPSVHRITLPLKRAVIAWQPSREATRALHDALPLLHEAGVIDVVVVDPDVGEMQHGEQPGADIAIHLTHHGLNVRVVNLSSDGSVSTALLRHAVHADAQLIVAGGYSHSRLREQILGGVTRDLLRHSHLPVLFSH